MLCIRSEESRQITKTLRKDDRGPVKVTMRLTQPVYLWSEWGRLLTYDEQKTETEEWLSAGARLQGHSWESLQQPWPAYCKQICLFKFKYIHSLWRLYVRRALKTWPYSRPEDLDQRGYEVLPCLRGDFRASASRKWTGVTRDTKNCLAAPHAIACISTEDRRSHGTSGKKSNVWGTRCSGKSLMVRL